jgi:hypothetical protein
MKIVKLGVIRHAGRWAVITLMVLAGIVVFASMVH